MPGAYTPLELLIGYFYRFGKSESAWFESQKLFPSVFFLVYGLTLFVSLIARTTYFK